LSTSAVEDGLKVPTGGFGNYSITMFTIADWLLNYKNFATKSYVDNSSNTVNQALTTHINNTSNPHNVTKAQVGLGNVNNTADLDKPISDATAAALTLKADKSNTYTKTEVDNKDSLKANITYVDTQLGLKADKTTTYTKTEVDTALNTKVNKSVYDVFYNHEKSGLTYQFDSQYVSTYGGYPLGAELILSDGLTKVVSTVANNTNDPNVNMMGWVKSNSAAQIIDSSGVSQQIINDLNASEGVNILSVYGGIDDFGVAIELAYAKAMETDYRKIIIPDGTFVSKTTANLTLESWFTIQFSGNTKINVENRVDVFNIVQGDNTLNVLGNGVAIYPVWSTGSSSVSVFVLDSQTLNKSLFTANVNIYESGGNKFDFGIKSVGLNYSTIYDCIIQAVNPIQNSSATSGGTHSMGCEVVACKLQTSTGTGVTLINNGDLGCEGWKFSGGEYLCKTGIKVIDNLNNNAYYPPLLIVDTVHINAERFFSFSGISRVKIASCDLQSQVTSGSEFKGLIEFDGVQVFDIDENTAISQANTTGSAPADSLPVFFLRNSSKSKTSAFLEFGIKNYWLDQTAPLIAFDTSISLAGRVNFSKINTGAFPTKIVDSADTGKVSISLDTRLTNAQVTTGFSNSTSATYNSTTGVLTLGREPSIGQVYLIPTSIVPNDSVINQVKVTECIGKEFTLVFDASNITLNHSASFYTPIGSQNKVLYGATLRLISYNSDLCRVISISPHAAILPANTPTSTSSSGINGQKVFSGGFVYEYIYGTGWVRYSASTF